MYQPGKGAHCPRNDTEAERVCLVDHFFVSEHGTEVTGIGRENVSLDGLCSLSQPGAKICGKPIQIDPTEPRVCASNGTCRRPGQIERIRF